MIVKHKYRFFVVFLLGLAVAGCSTTSRLGEAEVLYTGVKKIVITPDSGVTILPAVESAVKQPLSVAPNNPLYSPYVRTPFPIGLWAYNHLYTPKEKGIKHWIYNRLEKEPVLISKVQPELRTKVAESILDNYGYFRSKADYELLYRKDSTKAKVSYRLMVAPPYTYSEIVYPEVPLGMVPLVDSLHRTSLLRVGAQYNLDTLTLERSRISGILRNRGYYYFRSEYIEYQADTLLQKQKASIRLIINPNIPAVALEPYSVGRITVNLQNLKPGPPDTLHLKNMTVIGQRPMKIRPSVLSKSIAMTPGQLFTVNAQNQTQVNLNKLGIFRYVNLSVPPLDSLGSANSLNVKIDAAFDYPLEAEFETDVTSKSNSFIGPGVAFKVSNNNMFRGGEVFSVRLNGSYEWQTGNRLSMGGSSTINSYEFGLNSSLTVQRLLLPAFITNKIKYPAKTLFQLGADMMNRPEFFRMLSFNGSVDYDFQTSPYSYHTFTLFKLVYNKMLRTTPAFDETMAENPAIALSFKNQFIPSIGYVYTLDRTYGRKQSNRIFWQTGITSAGNILSGTMGLFGVKEPKRLFGNQFSQFLKGVSEFKYYYRMGKANWLVTRFLVGVGYAYGNSQVMPYSEQFYIGGANSIRAFTIRSLGPGSFRPAYTDRNSYLDQTGDFKLEANIEYRFHILGRLNGAIFLDAGNVWLLKNDPKRPGGALKWKGLLNEIALGTGAGLRYDISYLVIRADLGVGLHTPYPNPDKKGYYNIPNFKDGLGFHLAIGYPF